MVRKVGRGVFYNFVDFVHAFREFSFNARTYLFSAFLQSVGGSMIATVFALYIKSAGMGESTIGYVEGAMGIGMAVIALVGPPLVSTMGYRALMTGALVLLIGSRFAQGLLPMTTTLIALGLAVGVGDGFLRTVNSAFLSENSGHKERSHLFSSEFLVRMLAIFTGGLAGGFLPQLIGGAEQSGYQWTIYAGSAIMATGLVPMLFVREKIHGVKGFSRVYLQTVREFTAWDHLVKLVTPQAFLAAAGGLTIPFIPLYLRHTLGASVAQIGVIQGAGALIIGLAAFATPVIARRIGVAKGIWILQLLAVPFIAAVPYVGGLLYGVLLLYIRTTLVNVGAPLYNEFSMADLKAADKPIVSGGLFFSLSIMGFLGNVAGGRLMEVSYTAPYVPATALWIIGCVLTWAMWVRTPAEQTSTEHAHEHAPELVAEAA